MLCVEIVVNLLNWLLKILGLFQLLFVLHSLVWIKLGLKLAIQIVFVDCGSLRLKFLLTKVNEKFTG